MLKSEISIVKNNWLYVFLLTGGMAFADEAPAKGEKFEPTSQYEVRDVNGWKVFLNSRFEHTEPELCAETLLLLRHQFYQIERMLPAPAVKKVREIAVWVELDEPHHPCMCYHPDAGWLREHDMNPEKARCIEIANARNFLTWTKQQPWMVFHELAHGYHHQFVDGSYDNQELSNALKQAREEKLYDEVLHINGRTERHYALTNQMEYFAEQSEACFGTNDFYPFVRSELQKHDPRMFAIVRKLWGVEEKR